MILYVAKDGNGMLCIYTAHPIWNEKIKEWETFGTTDLAELTLEQAEEFADLPAGSCVPVEVRRTE